MVAVVGFTDGIFNIRRCVLKASVCDCTYSRLWKFCLKSSDLISPSNKLILTRMEDICCFGSSCWFDVNGRRCLIKELDGHVWHNQGNETSIRNAVHYLILCSLWIRCTQNDSHRSRNILYKPFL